MHMLQSPCILHGIMHGVLMHQHAITSGPWPSEEADAIAPPQP
jgi:hypothetical protein